MEIMFQDFNLSKGASIYIEKLYQVKPGMQVLVVTDTYLLHAGEALARAAETAGAEVSITIMSPRKYDNEEPPRSVANAMKGADLVVIAARHNLLHSKAVSDARDVGTAFTNAITDGRDKKLGEFNTTIDDLKTIKERNERIVEFFKDKDKVRITSRAGTDLTLSVKGRHWLLGTFFTSAPLYKKEGFAAFSENAILPDQLSHAETGCSPVKGSANGTYVVDTWMGGIGAIHEPIILQIKDGNVVEIRGGDEAERLKEAVQLKGEHAVNVAEMAFGTSHIIRTRSGTTSDKAILGGMHLAIGTSAGVAFQGEVRSEMHQDGVSLNMTVVADGTIMMKDGKLLI